MRNRPHHSLVRSAVPRGPSRRPGAAERLGARCSGAAGRILFPAALALVLAFVSLGCNKSEPKETPQKATPTPAAEAPRGTSGATFDPALLGDRFASRDFMVALPPKEGQVVRVTLEGKPPCTLALRVAVECADQASFDELTRRADSLIRVLTESVQSRDTEFARTTEGRLAIKEDIVARLQASLEHKGIKQVYFLDYRLETVR